jgi:hypothetical protein
MSLGANQITKASHGNFAPILWSKETIRAFEANLVLGNKVNRSRDGEVRSFGQSIKMNTISNLAAFNKVGNTAVALQDPTESQVTLLINQHKYTAFLVEDIIKAQSNVDLMSEYTSKAGYAVNKAFDSDIAALATGFSQSTGTYNTALTEDVLLDSVETLDLQDVPQNDRCFTLRPEAVRDLRDIDDYTRFDGTGYAGGFAMGSIGDGKGIRPNGLVGMLYNAPVYMTTQIQKAGNNISNMYFHKDAIAAAVQQSPRVQTQYKVEYLGFLTVVDMLYGTVELRDNAGLELKS